MKSTKHAQELPLPALEPHMRFICPECGKEFTTQHDWRHHLNVDHQYTKKTYADFDFKEINERFHECQICSKWVANARNAIALLQYHRFLHLPFSRTYRCGHCTGAFTRKRALCEHLMRFHSRQIARMEKQRQLKQKSSESNSGLSELTNPAVNSEFYLRFVCPQCGQQLDHFDQWLAHLDEAHPSTSTEMPVHRVAETHNYYCLLCCKLIFNADKARLQRHCFSHMPYKAYFKCAFCAIKKNFKSEILRHFLNVHPKARDAANNYLVKPQEWGGRITEKNDSELNLLLTKYGGSKIAPKKNLLHKALNDSSIEPTSSTSQRKRIAQKRAVDQSPNDLAAVVHGTPQSKQQNIEKSQCDSDLERLYNELCENLTSAKKVAVQETSSDEEIISIEIDAIGNITSAELEPKRLKLVSEGKITQASKDQKLDKRLFEPHITYICPACAREFQLPAAWRQHVFGVHNLASAIQAQFKPLGRNAFMCLQCKVVLRNGQLTERQRHHFMHMPFQAYLRCNHCNKTRSSKPKMLQHLQEEHAAQLDKPGVLKDTSIRPAGSTPLYDIEKNKRLIKHLHEASKRLDKIYAEMQQTPQ